MCSENQKEILSFEEANANAELMKNFWVKKSFNMKKEQEHLDPKKLDGLILTRNLTSKEQEKAKKELAEARRKVQSGLTDRGRLAAKILQFKLKLKEYLKKDDFDPDMRFSSCLVQYVDILEKKRRTFAQEIDNRPRASGNRVVHRSHRNHIVLNLMTWTEPSPFAGSFQKVPCRRGRVLMHFFRRIHGRCRGSLRRP